MKRYVVGKRLLEDNMETIRTPADDAVVYGHGTECFWI